MTSSLAPDFSIRLVVSAAVRYFAFVFGAGFIMGVVRVVLLVPRFGERAGELIEMPFMLAAIYFVARHLVRRQSSSINAFGWSLIGGIALLLLLAVEFGVVLTLRGLTFAEYVAGRDPVSGSVYIALMLLYAAMPWLLYYRRSYDAR